MTRFPRLVLVLVLLTATAALARGAWTRYGNARYGYHIDIPPGFTQGEAPANNDGRSFTSPDGSTLDVWGSNNVLDETLSKVYGDIVRERGSSIVYKTKGGTWFVVSWTADGRSHYQKQFVGKGSMCGFIFTYPAARKSAHAPVVQRLERTFKPGDLSQPH